MTSDKPRDGFMDGVRDGVTGFPLGDVDGDPVGAWVDGYALVVG